MLKLLASAAHSQDLGNITKEDPVQVSGGINATGIGYAAQGIDSRRDPYNWFMDGNINLSLYGWSVPFSFSYSNQQVTYRQPFNQYGVAPSYKWAKAYIGYNNLTLSRYSLAGHVFLGGGAELSPGKFRLTTMYGRLNKAVAEDTLNRENGVPAFKRMGFGIKAGFEDAGQSIHVVLFRAWDDIGSLPYVPEPSGILPKENLVLGLIGRKQLGKRIHWSAEFSTSALTEDTRSPQNESGGLTGNLGGLFTSRTSSGYHNAFNTSLGYNADRYSVQLNYERIAPGYGTLGAYFFNNDLENVTVSGATRFLRDKVNLSVNVGTQRNNLRETEISGTERIIANTSISYMPNAKWNINGSYSNFATFTNVRPRFDPFFRDQLDSLNFYQVTQNATTTVSYSFGPKERKQSLLFNGSYQVANEETEGTEAMETGSNYYNASASYRYALMPLGMTVATSMNIYRTELGDTRSLTVGPNLSLGKTLLDKALRNTLSASYNHQDNGEGNERKVLNIRLGMAFAPKPGEQEKKTEGRKKKEKDKVFSEMTGNALPENVHSEEVKKNRAQAPKKKKMEGRHRFSLNLVYLKSFEGTVTATPFSELTGTLTYGYGF